MNENLEQRYKKFHQVFTREGERKSERREERRDLKEEGNEGEKEGRKELSAPLWCCHLNRFQVNFLVVIVGLRTCQNQYFSIVRQK